MSIDYQFNFNRSLNSVKCYMRCMAKNLINKKALGFIRIQIYLLYLLLFSIASSAYAQTIVQPTPWKCRISIDNTIYGTDPVEICASTALGTPTLLDPIYPNTFQFVCTIRPDLYRFVCERFCPGYGPFNPDGTCLVSTPTCPVSALTPVTDAVALRFENGQYRSGPDLADLTPATNTGIACIQQQVASLGNGNSAHVTSGYRPQAYQDHIREVWDKWQQIKDDDTEACKVVKASIRTEWDKHDLVRRPVGSSNHSRGTAADISGVPAANADTIAAQCNMYRPEPSNDRVHYQPR